VHNRAELTLRCLSSLKKNAPEPFEIIIIDNASQDETSDLLHQVQGLRVLRNEQNEHFLLGANQGAKAARGKYLLFLNNDTELLSSSIESALNTLKSSSDIGAVGGKLILPDGSLQEAGSILWQDGSCAAYGRGENPFSGSFMFRRDVDFCSAAFLITPRETFFRLQCFDETFQPAYYEDVDYCQRLYRSGLRVVYDPQAALIHYEFGSSDVTQDAIALQIKNRKMFVQKHLEDLKSQPLAGDSLKGRERKQTFPRVLFIDDRVPHQSRGSGFPRSHAILTGLLRAQYFVTFYPISFINEDWSSVYSDLPREVEVILGLGRSHLESFLEKRKGYYSNVFVSRPQNMQIIQEIRKRRPDLFVGLKLIYDAEALFAMREAGKRQLFGQPISEQELGRLIRQETEISTGADLVLTVSQQEGALWRKYGNGKVQILGHAIDAQPGDTPFEEREGILFVGSIPDDSSPNADAIRWFITEIFPTVRQKLGSSAKLIVAGVNHSESLQQFANDAITFAGYREDLTTLYSRARIFIAPLRIAAGLPLKVYGAAAHGLPVVATSLLGEQLGWTDGEQILLAASAVEFGEKCVHLYQDAELWGRIRMKELEAVRTECSRETFQKKLVEYFKK
jgi:GT2 family glycosyltransferase/glycosyltransferase involved in cell wall biosynthesis